VGRQIALDGSDGKDEGDVYDSGSEIKKKGWERVLGRSRGGTSPSKGGRAGHRVKGEEEKKE